MALNNFAVSVKRKADLASLWNHPTNTHPAEPSPQDEKEHEVFSVVLSVYEFSSRQALGHSVEMGTCWVMQKQLSLIGIDICTILHIK